MRRLMEMVANRRVDLTPLVTHRFALDNVADACEVFSQQRGGVLKWRCTRRWNAANCCGPAGGRATSNAERVRDLDEIERVDRSPARARRPRRSTAAHRTA
jgi:hypothetical protein